MHKLIAKLREFKAYVNIRVFRGQHVRLVVADYVGDDWITFMCSRGINNALTTARKIQAKREPAWMSSRMHVHFAWKLPVQKCIHYLYTAYVLIIRYYLVI